MPYADPEKRKANSRAYYQRNKQKILAYVTAWKKVNRPTVPRPSAPTRDDIRIRGRKYYQANRERIIARVAAYYATHSAEQKASARQYAKANREKYNAYNKKYAKANRDKCNTILHRYRSRKKQVGGFHTTAEWNALVKFYDHRCLACNKQEPEIKLQRDHIVPISRGGSNNISNIQPLCGRCNVSKGAVHTTDFRRGLLFCV